VSAPALVPSPLYGMRTWSVVGERGHERLAGPQRASPWPTDGAWLEATCEHGDRHTAPAAGCECGIHAWHPERRAAKRVLATRGQVAGVVEASGAIEVHRDGFRAERARPYALVLAPRTNAGLIDRLASAYDVEVVPANGPDAIVAWCRARGLGLERSVVDGLLGPERVAQQRRQTRAMRLRIVAAVAAIAVLVGVGLVATADPGDRTLQGRAGEVKPR
jgi:hypothetical protein